MASVNVTKLPNFLPGHGKLAPFGALIHTTGDGIPAKAHETGRDLLDVAINVYSNMREGPHFVIVPDGRIAQLRSSTEVTWHAGVGNNDRRDFLNGDWVSRVSQDVVTWWRSRWPNVKSPSHLYPTTSPNDSYIGIENVPCGLYISKRGWVPEFGVPACNTRFTAAQYLANAALVFKLSEDHNFDLARTGRVLGHEDVNPITRPGWDPGSKIGAWDWKLFWGLLDGLVRRVLL